MEPLFRQESYYQYLFGVKEADTLSTIDLSTGAWTLFIPRLPETFAIWMGQIHRATAVALPLALAGRRASNSPPPGQRRSITPSCMARTRCTSWMNSRK